MPKIEIKFLHYFACDSTCVLEAKILGLPDGAPPGQVFHWLQYDVASQQVQKFDFKSMGSEGDRQCREFEQGKLVFDRVEARLSLDASDSDEVLLEVCDPESVPKDLADNVSWYLESEREGQ